MPATHRMTVRSSIAVALALAISLLVGCKSSKQGTNLKANPKSPKLAQTGQTNPLRRSAPTAKSASSNVSKIPPKLIPTGPLIRARMLIVQTETCIIDVGSDQGMKQGAIYDLLIDGKSIGRLTINTANTKAAGCQISDLKKRPIKGQAIELQLMQASN